MKNILATVNIANINSAEYRLMNDIGYVVVSHCGIDTSTGLFNRKLFMDNMKDYGASSLHAMKLAIHLEEIIKNADKK
jgi:hypothetical protein